MRRKRKLNKYEIAGRITRKVIIGLFQLSVMGIFAYFFIYLLFLAPYDYEDKMTERQKEVRREILNNMERRL